MSYIEENLTPGEYVVYRTSLSKATFVFPIIAIIVCTVITAIIWDGATAFVFFIFLLIGVVVPWEIGAYLQYKSSEFGITNKRVLIKIGLIRRVSLETMLSKVEGIQVFQGILGRLLNYGTIIIKGTGGTSNPFTQIDSPLEFRKKVQEQISLN